MPHLIAFVAAFLLALAGIGVVNVWTNLGHAFRGDYALETRIARDIDAGRHVQGSWEFDIAAAQLALIDLQTRPPDAVVFGSSRAMQVGARHLGGGRVFNHAVDSAVLETHLGLFGRYDGRGLHPRTVLLSLDPWIFKNPDNDPALRLMTGDIRRFAAKIGAAPDPALGRDGDGIDRFAELFSLPRFRAALAATRDDRCGEVRAAADAASPCAVRLPDMSLRYPADWRARDPETVAGEVALSVSQRGRMHGFSGFERIEPRQADNLRRFLDYLVRGGTRVVILLVPYHPVLADRLRGRRDWTLTQAAEARIRKIAAEAGVPVLGAYDPAVAGCGAGEFFDRSHPRPACIDRIMAGMPAHTAREDR